MVKMDELLIFVCPVGSSWKYSLCCSYNIGADFYASRPDWYVDGDNRNGESSKAHKAAFNTDYSFNIAEYFHFCNRLLKKEPAKGEKDAPCMIVFCSFQQEIGRAHV